MGGRKSQITRTLSVSAANSEKWMVDNGTPTSLEFDGLTAVITAPLVTLTRPGHNTNKNRARAPCCSMSDPSIIVAEAFKQFSQVTVSAVGPGCILQRSILQPSFQLRAYEHGTRARLTQAEDDLRVLRHERDDSMRDLNACKEQSRAWLAEVNRWKAEARPHCSLSSMILIPTSFTSRQTVHYLW